MKETKPKAPLFSRRAGSNRAKKLYEMHISDVKNRLKNVQYMSATCDIWSCKHRSFIAVNICYIDPKSFEQKSFLIAIDRFEGSHTNNAVAAKLKDIFKRFHILGKVVGVTTDDASEFVVAFQRFGDNYATYENYLNLNERDEVAISDSTVFEAEQLRSDADAIILSSDDEGHGYDYDSDDWLNVDVDESLPPIIIESIDDNDMETTRSLANEFGQSTATTAPDENFHLVPIPVQVDFRTVVHDDGPSEVNTLLPIRIKCAAHTLNLLGKTDAIKALQNKTYAAVYCKVMAKLNLLWRYCGHRKKCEIIKQYIGKVILRPHKIRWNALYDSIHEIVQIDASKLDALFFKLHIAVFTESERQFLGEYLNVLQPIAHGLTRLEGNIFFAYFLITLFNVDEELRLLESTNLKFAKPLLKALRNGFDTRFKEMMDINNAASVPLYLAMLSHPLFKLNFLPMLKTKERSTALEYIAKCKGMLLKAIEDIDCEQNNNQTAQSSNSDEFDVASLLDMECGRSDIILLEIKNFLRDKLTTDFESTFRTYPNMKEVFLKFNCLMTSEANCERIFSYADAISFGSYVKENMTIRCTMPLFYPTIV
ncbi:uncharacterized protein LOC129570688 [Sitodiplosis mosellana]|uniref:uncharacterized protein LOC129570688 n=1 Tax=Sitodiplosis mosellana TaxID=263140 RepID=UPI002444F1E6|nr:uncharacterized protein LOC129570688 [Sitodiplosis mosellana]